jgi:hypothetical protein
MKRNKDFSLVKLLRETIMKEAVTTGSSDAENVLALLMSNQSKSKEEFTTFLKSKNTDSDFLKKYFDTNIKKGDYIEIYYGAIVQIKKEKLPSNAYQSGESNFQTTDVWKSYGGIKSARSKADVVSPGKTFSVKNASTQVRVLDAATPQISALILCALDQTKQTSKIKEIVKTNLDTLKKLSTSEGSKLSRQYGGEKKGLSDLRKINDPKLKNMISKFDENTKAMNDEIHAIFEEIRSKNDFKKALIYESLSGKIMFGENSEGRADSILTWTADFSKVTNHDIEDVSNKILSAFTIPKFGSKSSGSRISKTIQMFFQETNEQFDRLVKEEKKLLERRNSKLITENVFSNLWNTLKEKGKALIDKFVDGVKKFIDMVYEKMASPLQELLSFLGIQISIEETYSLDASINYESL